MPDFALVGPSRLALQGTLSVSGSLGYTTAPQPVVTTAQLTGSTSATAGQGQTYTLTLKDQFGATINATQSYSVTWLQTGGATLTPSSGTITVGNSSLSTLATWPTAVTGSIDFSISPVITKSGAPITVSVTSEGFTFPANGDLILAANTKTILGTFQTNYTAQASPDLLPGIKVVWNGAQLEAAGDSTVPQILSTETDTVKAAVRDQDIRIEVLDSVVSPMIVRTTPSRYKEYPSGGDYVTGATGTYPPGRWNQVMREAQAGDTFEIAPGAVHSSPADLNNYFSNSISGALLIVSKPIASITSMAGRGRWKPTALDDKLEQLLPSPSGAGGIVVYAPEDLGVRANILLEGFEFDNWGQRADAAGVDIKGNFANITNSWSDFHASITVRNFKIGKRSYYRSGQGMAGTAQSWIIEDGHIYDCGGGLGGTDGNDHNVYISGQTLTMRGVRSNRTRGNTALGWWEGGSDMDGHHLKLDFNTATIEGSVFDCGLRGDSSIQIQMKGGGNLIVRGCLTIAGKYSQSGTGNIVYEREYNQDGVTPNYITWAHGAAGHSVLLERNVFVSHYPNTPYQRAFLYFRPNTHPHYVPGVSSVIVRDNIGLNSVADSSLWIVFDPTAGGSWTARGNFVEPYSEGEFAFKDRELLMYRRTLGPLAAGQGSATIPAFKWPHGYVNVTRSSAGLG